MLSETVPLKWEDNPHFYNPEFWALTKFWIQKFSLIHKVSEWINFFSSDFNFYKGEKSPFLGIEMRKPFIKVPLKMKRRLLPADVSCPLNYYLKIHKQCPSVFYSNPIALLWHHHLLFIVTLRITRSDSEKNSAYHYFLEDDSNFDPCTTINWIGKQWIEKTLFRYSWSFPM